MAEYFDTRPSVPVSCCKWMYIVDLKAVNSVKRIKSHDCGDSLCRFSTENPDNLESYSTRDASSDDSIEGE